MVCRPRSAAQPLRFSWCPAPRSSPPHTVCPPQASLPPPTPHGAARGRRPRRGSPSAGQGPGPPAEPQPLGDRPHLGLKSWKRPRRFMAAPAARLRPRSTRRAWRSRRRPPRSGLASPPAPGCPPRACAAPAGSSPRRCLRRAEGRARAGFAGGAAHARWWSAKSPQGVAVGRAWRAGSCLSLPSAFPHLKGGEKGKAVLKGLRAASVGVLQLVTSASEVSWQQGHGD